MNKLKVGIIGCGGIANTKHLPALYHNNDLCEIIAFCDVVKERAIKAAKDFGTTDAKIYTNHIDLINNDKIDVVHILTTNVSHCEIAVAAFEAEKHVMCEKPMAHNALAAQKMIDAWKKAKTKFTIGYQNRFRPEVQSLYAACKNGELGEIYYAKAHAIRRRAIPTWGAFTNKSQQGGGPLVDIGTHALDMTLWMMNNYSPVSVTGSVFYKLGRLPEAVPGNIFGQWNTDEFEVEDSAFGFIKMADGSAIYLESAWALNILESKEASVTLCGTKAGAEIRSGISYPENKLYYNKTSHGLLTEEKLSDMGNVAYFMGKQSDPGVIEARQWLEAILNDTEPLVKPEQAFVVTKILDCIYKSDMESKEIRL